MAVAMPALDSQWFPHITTLILDALIDDLADRDPVFCLKLQAVCRAWQSTIKKRIFSHIVIIIKRDYGPYHVSTIPKSICFEEHPTRSIVLGHELLKLLPFAHVLNLSGTLPLLVGFSIAVHATNLETVHFRGEPFFFWPSWDPRWCFPPEIAIEAYPAQPRDFPKDGGPQWWHISEDRKLNVGVNCRIAPGALTVMCFPKPGKERQAIERFKLSVLIPMLSALDGHCDITVVLDVAPDYYEELLKRADISSCASPGSGTLKFFTHNEYHKEVEEERYEQYLMEPIETL